LSLESLESRCLLSTISEFPFTVGGRLAGAAEIASASGKLWITNQVADAIEQVDPGNPTGAVAYSQGILGAPSVPKDITAGPDGNAWFTEPSGHAVGMINATDPNRPIVNFGAAQGLPANAQPSGITAGPDQSGNSVIWFTDPSNNALGKIDPSRPTTMTEVGVPSNLVGFLQFPSRITAAGGKLWFTEALLNSRSQILKSAIGIYNPASNTWSEIVLPGGAGQEPFGLGVGPSGIIWFSVVNSTTASIGEIDLTKTPVLTETPVPTPAGGTTPLPYRITVGQNGTVWFTDRANGAIGQYNPSSRTFVWQAIRASTAPLPVAFGITAAQDGNVWFTVSTDAQGGPSTVGVVARDTKLVVSAQPPASVGAGNPFSLTVVVETSFSVLDPTFSGPVSVALQNNPGGSTLGGTLTVVAKGGVATFSGLTVNNPGNGYTLVISSSGLASTSTIPFNVPSSQPPPQPEPPIIIGQNVVFTQHTNKKGKPVGRKTLAGFEFDFNKAMNPATAGNTGSYQLGTFFTKRVKKKVVKLFQTVGFSVSYNASNNSVRLLLSGRQKFSKGGQITLLATDITSSDGAALASNVVFIISTNARSLLRA
jgi:virginiamycin B lyase